MTQEELMIGDWVQDEKNNVVKIDTHWTLYNAEFFDPIPITTKILKENEFVYNEEKDLLTCWIGNSFIDYDTNTHYFMIVKKGRSYEGSLEYVHELQHVLKLCKIDKEIKL